MGQSRIYALDLGSISYFEFSGTIRNQKQGESAGIMAESPPVFQDCIFNADQTAVNEAERIVLLPYKRHNLRMDRTFDGAG